VVLELLLVLGEPEQPLATRPATMTSVAPATVGRCRLTVLATLLMAHRFRVAVLEELSLKRGTVVTNYPALRHGILKISD